MGMTAFEIFGVLKLDSSDFDKELKNSKSTAESVLGKVGTGIASGVKVGLAAVGAATTAVVGFAGEAVKVGSNFDQAMGSVAATMGTTVDEMGEDVGSVDTAFGRFEGTLRDFAMFMGKNTVFSASEAAAALNYMALAGYDTKQSMEMLPAVLDMAAAGAMDLATASDMITDTQSALALNSDRTKGMVNEFAKAASTGNTSVQQLGEAFLRVGGLAKELNGGMVTLADGTKAPVDGVQELEIAFTAMANAGVKGNEAGTHMRNMLLKLSSPTKDGVKAMEDLGVSVFDAEGNMRSLSDIFGDLNVAFGTLTQEQKIQAISDLFNTRDMASAEALLGAVGQDWNEIGESILQADGAANQMSKTKLDNLTGDMTLFKSALETAQITINDQLSPTLRQFVQFGTSAIQTLSTAFEEGGLSGAMSALGTILSEGLNMIIQDLPKYIDAGMQLLGALGQGLLDNLPVIIDAAVQIIGQLNMGFLEAMPALLEGALQIILGLADGIIASLPELIPAVVDTILQIVNVLIENVDMLVDAAVAIILGLADGLIAALPDLVPAIVQVILKIVEKLTEPEMLMKLVDAAFQILIALADGLIQAIPELLKAAPVIMLNFITAVVELLPQMVKLGLQMISTLAVSIGEAGVKIKAAAIQIFNTFKDSINERIDRAREWGQDLIDSFINGIRDRFNRLGETLTSLGQLIKGFIHFSEPDVGPLADFHTYAPDMIDLFVKGLKDNTDKIQDQFAETFSLDSPEVNANITSANGVSSNGVPVTINVYGAPGQSEDELAEIISRKIAYETRKQGMAWGMA